jgi:hypothetical protein
VFEALYYLRAEGTKISVALDGIGSLVASALLSNLFPAKANPLSEDDNMAAKTVKDFPKPMSSARIPPKTSSGFGFLAPVMVCW